jgi:glutaredoxin
MILVTASWCAPCNELKDWIFLTDNGEGIEYVDIDLDLDGLSHSIRSVPTLIVDETTFVGNEEIRPFLSACNVVEL